MCYIIYKSKALHGRRTKNRPTVRSCLCRSNRSGFQLRWVVESAWLVVRAIEVAFAALLDAVSKRTYGGSQSCGSYVPAMTGTFSIGCIWKLQDLESLRSSRPRIQYASIISSGALQSERGLPPPDILPSVSLTINQKRYTSFRAAHELREWWHPHAQCEFTENRLWTWSV